jgi:hypothetical protein
LDGIWTVRRLRPFLRRRDSTARPQRVFMRCRNPCLRTRLRLRGRYVGPTGLCLQKAAKRTRFRRRGSRLTFQHRGHTFGRPLDLPL